MSSSLSAALREMPLLSGAGAALIAAIAAQAETLELRGGDILFRQGDPADSLYFVLSGRLRVFDCNAEGETAIAEIAAGETVGEMAALTGDPRSATVVAIRNCRLARLHRDRLNRLLGSYPELLGCIALLLARRLGQSGRAAPARKPPSCFTLLKASESVALELVVARLGAALERFAKVAVVHPPGGPDGFDLAQPDWQSRFADRASAIEAASDVTLFVGGAQTPEWDAMCVRQADLVLLCGDPAAPPPARERLAAAIPPWANVGLILCRSDRESGWRTGEWLDAYPGAVHFNVRLDVPGEFERLARLLAGRGAGVVFGGGGARGMAHIGVIRALNEAGIPVDRVGGTSQGALIGALLAIGWNDRYSNELVRRLRDDNLTNDFTVPVVSLIAGKKAERALEMQFGDRRIEDLPTDFFCVSSSLTTGRLHVHRRGLLWQALRASVSIPGIFPPFAQGGELLVDGGVLDNLPIAPMRQRGTIQVIAVNVTPLRGLTTRPSPPPKWRHLSFLGRPREGEDRNRLPSIFQTLVQAGMLNTISRLDALRRQADLFIQPPVDRFRILDWDRADEIAEIGYREARKQLQNWQGEVPAAQPAETAELIAQR
jgi:NTE family protein